MLNSLCQKRYENKKNQRANLCNREKQMLVFTTKKIPWITTSNKMKYHKSMEIEIKINMPQV